MKPKRAALFLPSLEGGGAERHLLSVAKGLVEHGFSVDMVLARAAGPFLPLLPPGVRLIDLQSKKTLASLPGLLEYLKSERPEAMLPSLNAIVTALVAKKFFAKDVRVVANYQSTFSEEMRHAPRAGRAAMTALRLLLPTADAVVVASRGAAEDLTDRVPAVRGRTRVIWNAVDVPPRASVAAVPHPWFENPGPPIVLSVGRLDAGKDHRTLLKAFAEVRRRRPVRLVVLGEGPLRASLESLSRSLGVDGCVDFPGFQPNPYGYMARAQVFAFSSRFEGMPVVLLEALAFGTPVVSTDCPHGPAEILEEGRWGRLVPVGDWRSMAEAVLATLESPPAPGPLIDRARAFSAFSTAGRFAEALFPGF